MATMTGLPLAPTPAQPPQMGGWGGQVQNAAYQAPAKTTQAAGTASAVAPGTTPYTPGASSSYAPGVNLTATNPSNDLRGQTITPGATANRVDIANADLQNWQQQQAPIYQQNLRAATQQAAGAGQLGSGQLRTSLGDLAYNQNQATNAAMGNFTQNALTGSIQDAYNNVGIAQQQQQFQAGLQNQTFNQGLQALQAGNSGNPADTQLALSSLYGNQAQGGQQAVAGAVQSAANQSYQQQILNMLGQRGFSSSSIPSTSASSPIYGSLGNPSSYIGNGVTY